MQSKQVDFMLHKCNARFVRIELGNDAGDLYLVALSLILGKEMGNSLDSL